MVEILFVLIIVGVLSAIIMPSFIGMLNRNKVSDSLNQVRGALEEAQREAIRRSRSCTVTINTTTRQITSPCLVMGTRDLCEQRDNAGNCTRATVAIATNLGGTPPTIQFSFRGNTTNSGTIVVYTPDNSTPKIGCLVISNGLGIMRTGEYNGSTAAVSANNCSTTTATTAL
jgi:type II secretory pathway pseudopilin PulG